MIKRDNERDRERETDRQTERDTERERSEICPSLAFQDHQLIIHLSKMQDIMNTNPNWVLHFIQIVQNYFTMTKICY